jgi:multicomponent Na+:H+ antiporter subunit G
MLAAVGTRDGAMITRAVLVGAFLVLTSPVSAHAIANAAYRRERGVAERAVADAVADGEAGDGTRS